MAIYEAYLSKTDGTEKVYFDKFPPIPPSPKKQVHVVEKQSDGSYDDEAEEPIPPETNTIVQGIDNTGHISLAGEFMEDDTYDSLIEKRDVAHNTTYYLYDGRREKLYHVKMLSFEGDYDEDNEWIVWDMELEVIEEVI